MRPSLAGFAAACVMACVTALAQTTDSAAVKLRLLEVALTFALTVAVSGDSLTIQGTNQPALPAMYQGRRGWHPRCFIPQVNAEIKFLPDATGAIGSLVLHQGGDHPAKKRPAN